MIINIFFLKVKKDISEKNKKYLRKIIRFHAKKAIILLGMDFINIVVYPNAKSTIPETGDGGYAPNSDWVSVFIDPLRKEKEIEKIIGKNIPETIYHEINHAARWQSPGYGKTLLESIISEGLATVFAEDQWPLFRVPWGVYTAREINKYLSLLRKRDRKRGDLYNHSEWFFGEGKPRWLGYKVGAYIIRLAKERNPEVDLIKMTCMKAREVLLLSGIKI